MQAAVLQQYRCTLAIFELTRCVFGMLSAHGFLFAMFDVCSYVFVVFELTRCVLAMLGVHGRVISMCGVRSCTIAILAGLSLCTVNM